jgi:hypothetical protein
MRLAGQLAGLGHFVKAALDALQSSLVISLPF